MSRSIHEGWHTAGIHVNSSSSRRKGQKATTARKRQSMQSASSLKFTLSLSLSLSLNVSYRDWQLYRDWVSWNDMSQEAPLICTVSQTLLPKWLQDSTGFVGENSVTYMKTVDFPDTQHCPSVNTEPNPLPQRSQTSHFCVSSLRLSPTQVLTAAC